MEDLRKEGPEIQIVPVMRANERTDALGSLMLMRELPRFVHTTPHRRLKTSAYV